MRNATTQRSVRGEVALDRIGALSGATYIVLGNVAMFVGTDPEMPGVPTGQESLDGLTRLAANPLAQGATSVELFGLVAWMVFVGYVAWRVRAAGWLAAAVLVGGITQIAVKVGSALPMVTAYALRDEIPPETALVLTQEALTAAKVSALPAGLFVLAASIAALRTRELGRPLGWAGVAFGAVIIVVATVTGVNVGRDGFVPSFLLVMLWTLVVSAAWGFGRRSGAVPQAAP